jgi:hypothetical protein
VKGVLEVQSERWELKPEIRLELEVVVWIKEKAGVLSKATLVEEQIFYGDQAVLEAQVKLEVQVEVEQEVGLLMIEEPSVFGLSQNLRAVKVILVPRQKHLGSGLLLMIPFRSRPSSQTPSKRQKCYWTNISLFSYDDIPSSVPLRFLW